MNRSRRQIWIARRTRAWELRARGWTQARIGRELGLHQGTVSRLLAWAERHELRRFQHRWEATKVHQNAMLEHATEEAFDAWHSSKKPLKRAGSKSAGEGEEVVTTEVIERDGNTAYLHAAMNALA